MKLEEIREKLRDKEVLFIIMSIIFILFMFIFYGSRLVHYYKIEHPKPSSDETTYLVDILKSKETVIEPGLVKKNSSYYYVGDVEDNYLKYSGILFRIIKINEDLTIELISSENQTLLNFNNVYDWMNKTSNFNSGKFIKNINQDLLTTTSICKDVINDINNVTCNEIVNNYNVELISLYDYVQAGANNSYLNNDSYFYISSLGDNKYYYIFDEGGVSSKDKDDHQNYGIRPVITLKSGVEIISGDGTIDNPYIVEKEKKESLKDTNINDYVEFNNQLFKVIDKEEDKVLVALDGVLSVKDKKITTIFDSYSTIYQKNTLIYEYLNKTYYETFKNKDYIIKSDFKNGEYSFSNQYNLNEIYENKTNANIGLLSIGDFNINEVEDVFLMTSGGNVNYIINEEKLYGVNNNTEHYLRPILYLDNNLKITNDGTKENPYQLSR